jgi:uncharacterized protein (TIRG00374 family)
LSAPPVSRKGTWLLIKLAVTCLVSLIVLRFVPLKELSVDIRRTDPYLWGGVLFVFLLGHCAAAAKWRLLIGQGPSYLMTVRAHLAGLGANLALPGITGGDVARAALVATSVRSKAQLIMGSLLDRVIDIMALVFLAAVGAILLGVQAGPSGRWLAIAAITALVMGILSLGFAGHGARVLRRFHASGKLRPVIDRTAHVLESADRHRTALILCFVVSAGLQFVFATMNVLICASMEGPADFAKWLFAWPLAKLIAVLPISLGGFGVREASLAAVFASLGTSSSAVVATSLVWQSILIAAGIVGLLIHIAGSGKTALASR